MGVAVPGMDIGVESGAGDEVAAVPEGVGVIVPELMGRLQADSTSPIPRAVSTKGFWIGFRDLIKFGIRSGSRFGKYAGTLPTIFRFDLDGHMVDREFFLQQRANFSQNAVLVGTTVTG